MISLNKLFSLARGTLHKLKPASGIWLTLVMLWLVVLIAAWWGAPHLEINGHRFLLTRNARIIFTLLWLLLALVVILWRLWYRIKRLIHQPVPVSEPDHYSLATARQQHFLDSWLQALHSYAGAGTKYRLPWYLLIGVPESGKTSLIHRVNSASRLNIRLNSELRELSKGQSVDIWLGDEAVIFDPKGRLLIQQAAGDGQEAPTTDYQWYHLLRWLNNNRPRQPLNGVILTIDLVWLAQSTVSERKVYAQLMRERLLEITSTLNTRLPLYLVLTRLDLLHGFDGFYRKTDKQNRDTLLGVSFTTQGNWPEQLEHFWQQWIGRLNGQLGHRLLDTSGEPQTEAALFSFIRQLDGIKDYLSTILDEIITQEPHHLLSVRGLYFSSVYQQGVPFDVFYRAAARRYQLPEIAWPARRGESVVFFVHDLFRQIIFPQAHLAGESRLHRLYRRRKLSAGLSLMALIALGFTGGWQYYYQINHQTTAKVLEKSQQFIVATNNEKNSKRGFGADQLPRLNLIGDATIAFGDYRHKLSLLADMGLYQGDKIGPYVENSYLALLQQRFLPAIMQGLKQDLDNAPALSEQKLNILRIMRMLEDASGRNKPLVQQFMAQRWQQAFPNQGSLQQQLARHLNYALEHTDWHSARQRKDNAAITAWQPFASPVQQAQTELRKLPLFLRVYQSLSSQAADTLPANLQIRDEVGSTYDEVFSLRDNAAGSIPRFYSWQGFANYFTRQQKTLQDITAEDAWVLGLKEKVHLSQADWQEIQRQVSDRYITDYINRWQSLLTNLNVQPVSTPEQALHLLSDISGNEQPLRRVIATLSDNTHLRISDKSSPADQQINHRIAIPFTALNNTLTAQGEAAAAIQNANQKLLLVYQWLEQITSAADPGQAALKAIRHRLADPYSDPVTQLQQYARSLPAPLNRWYNGIAVQIQTLTMGMALSSLNQIWQENVLTPFNQQLADRYPFNPDSDQDVPLSEMEKFFASGGTMDSFYQVSIKPLVDAGLLSSQPVNTQQRELFSQLNRVQHIRDTLFNAQGSLEYHFMLEPLELTANKRRSVLDLDGQLVDYSHGRRQKTPLIWPNIIRAGSQSRLTLVPDNRERSPRSLIFTGPWAMFRLIDAGELMRVSAGSFDVRFAVDKGSMSYRIYTDESRNPFTRDMFSQFFLPESLYRPLSQEKDQ